MDTIEILTGDFRELSRDLADDSIDLVLTDPPYPKEYLPLWEDLGRVAARVLKPGGSLVTYCGNYQIPDVLNSLCPHLRYWWSLVIEHGGPTARLPGKWVFAHHKPALWFVKGHRCGKRYVADVIRGNGRDKRYHEWGQGISEFAYLIEQITQPGDLVLDPFLGGGTTAVAALQTGRRCVAYELDPDTAEKARRRVARESLFVAKPGPVQFDFETVGLPHCKYCGAILETNGGPGRKREYCNDVCRQRAFRDRRRKEPREPRPGYVYLLSSKEGYCKIGRTTNLAQRLDTFSVLPPFNFELDHTIPADDMFNAENALHQRFAKKRANGEWFKLDIDDIELIRGLSEYRQGEFVTK